VTRAFVLRLAKRKKITIKETRILPKSLLAADECFITNTTLEIMPVTSINKRRIGSGKPGPVTALLHQEYRKEVLACLATQAG